MASSDRQIINVTFLRSIVSAAGVSGASKADMPTILLKLHAVSDDALRSAIKCKHADFNDPKIDAAIADIRAEIAKARSPGASGSSSDASTSKDTVSKASKTSKASASKDLTTAMNVNQLATQLAEAFPELTQARINAAAQKMTSSSTKTSTKASSAAPSSSQGQSKRSVNITNLKELGKTLGIKKYTTMSCSDLLAEIVKVNTDSVKAACVSLHDGDVPAGHDFYSKLTAEAKA